jgi:dihydrofolate synthase/folylpolyglutamate synthase
VGIGVSEHAIRAGLRSVEWPGRFEILGRAPLVVADSAHNGDSARKLVATLQAICDFRRLTIVLGGSADHLTADLLQALLTPADRIIVTRSQHPRAADPLWLQARGAELGFDLEVSETVAQGLAWALDGAGEADLICCTGSVFVAAEARLAWFSRQGLPLPPTDPA